MLTDEQLQNTKGILSQIKRLSIEYTLPEPVIAQIVHAVLVNGATVPTVKQKSIMERMAATFGMVFDFVKIRTLAFVSSGGEKKATTGDV